jgi:protein SMG6
VLFEGHGGQGQGNGTDDSGNSVFSIQLKKMYRALSNLETKIKQEVGFVGSLMEDGEGMNGVIVLGGKEWEKGLIIKGKGKETTVPYIEPGEVKRERWKKIINDHKECVCRISPFFQSSNISSARLAEISHNLLEISLSPSVPTSLRNIPTKYNLIVRLWTYGFHKLLESLRRASFTSPLALEHLQDFIYYAYSFYTGLLEEHILNSFRSGWLEALGDLARYGMAVAAMVSGGVRAGGLGGQLTSQAVSEASTCADQSADGRKEKKNASNSTKSLSDRPAARIDDSPSPNRRCSNDGCRTRDGEVASDCKRMDGAGLAEQPGTGKLHHHLGLLEREVEGEELRGCYHFVKR